MATSKIQFTVTDGNLFSAIAGEDHVSALVFDVTTSPSGGAIAADGRDLSLRAAADDDHDAERCQWRDARLDAARPDRPQHGLRRHSRGGRQVLHA